MLAFITAVSAADRQLLVSDNRRRWTTYRLATPSDGVSHARQMDSVHLAPDSAHLPPDSAHWPDEWQALQSIAADVAAQGKMTRERLRETIVTLCKGRFLTAGQLGELLHRHPDGLRSRYLMPMVQEGLLRLRYPAAVHRPDQAYTTSERTA